ncbi:hypothetical protein [Gordonia soli]|uniref:hypothetical protein n=1 Tax=Gordonia soli TaxID=320799 RepID=UPI0012FCB71F|nr:hypothetical protein [Gordonia soli]
MTQTRYSKDRNDVAGVIGLYTRGAAMVAAAVVLAGTTVTVGTIGVQARLPVAIVALMSLIAGAIVLLRVPGDPLPWRAAVFVSAIPATQVGVLCPSLPVPLDPLQLAPAVGGGAVLCAFLCTRGRVLCAWGGQIAALVVLVSWSLVVSQPVSITLGLFVSNAGVMLMATYFAWLLRPAITTLFRLRADQTRLESQRAAAEAAQIERAAQQTRLDRLARPMLGLIAHDSMSDGDVERARLLEALLRDSIRARALDVPEINRAAWQARARGVSVQLLDDGALDTVEVAASARSQLYRLIASCLAEAGSGTVTVRVQPPGRHAVVTVVTTIDGSVSSRELTASALEQLDESSGWQVT